ncbi:MAG: DUF1553 domain-containing protein [Pedosphaera sp.]|nr:DUF1553 domain-containing protein [Pedosphaera sp.]
MLKNSRPLPSLILRKVFIVHPTWFNSFASAMLLLAILTARGAEQPIPRLARPVDFAREVFPLLEKNCFECHGPKKQKSSLRLDSKEAILKGGDSGPAIVVGKGDDSAMFRRVAAVPGEDPMPPKGERLSPDGMAMIRAWIDQGAEWPAGIGATSAEVKKHWAYVAPVHHAPPNVKTPQWARNPIDNFVLARLEQEILKPAPEASRETLIRRLSLDLIGLPPTPDEVNAFLKNHRADAYERLVDRLLLSPHYGERWARPWLDLARYADTNGYEADNRRTIWPYRDWVINALNRDLPFDQFVIEQFAGDLLPNATTEQKIATGFHRNTMVNTEGGTDEEEFRTAAIVDRINTTFEALMGSTIGCAQCHNHKYDPFKQTEYYQIFAFLNQTKDKGRTTDPELELATPEQSARRKEVRDKIEPLQKMLDTQTFELDAALTRWEEKSQAHRSAISANWKILEPAELRATGGVKLEQQSDKAIFSTGELPAASTYELLVSGAQRGVSAFRLEALTDARLPHKSSGRNEDGTFTLTDFSVEILNTETNKVEFDKAYADFSEDHFEAGNAIDKNEKSGWSIGADEPTNRVDRTAVFMTKKAFDADVGAKLVIRLKQESIREQHLLGKFRLAAGTASNETFLAWAAIPTKVRTLLEIPPDKRTDEQKKELAKHYRSIHPEFDKTREQIAELKKQEPKDVARTLVMEVMATNRPTHILVRGNHLNKGAEVKSGVPAMLHRLPKDAPMDRLTFAKWIVDPANPLTGRVMMNRVWAQYFGRGMVETLEDFGAQGEPPSHPELLDWLATEWVRQGWSLKAMHRAIITSATYRQNSRTTSELIEKDPYNRLLAHGPRFRMEAEMVRDTALAVSGLLNRKIGGPSVFPYQPEGVWANPYSDDKWRTSKEGDQFRRGLYTFWRRTSPYASFMAFDAPSREVSCTRRPRTNTPLQALVTLNDPAFVATAAGFARRIVNEGGASLAQRLDFAFKAVVSRKPTKEESDRLLALYRKSYRKYVTFDEGAVRLSEVGMEKAASPATNNAIAPDYARQADLAAWTVLANVLLNLDEAVTKG